MLYPADAKDFSAQKVVQAFSGDEGGLLRRFGSREVEDWTVARLVREVGLVKSNSIAPPLPPPL